MQGVGEGEMTWIIVLLILILIVLILILVRLEDGLVKIWNITRVASDLNIEAQARLLEHYAQLELDRNREREWEAMSRRNQEL